MEQSRGGSAESGRPDSTTSVLIDGDADDILAQLRAAAEARGATLLASGAGTERAALLVVAIRQGEGRSGLAQGLAKVAELRVRTEPGAVAIVIVVKGAARVAPTRLAGLLGPEILFQVRSAVDEHAEQRVWRTVRLRVGLTALTALGVRVFRAAPTSA